MWSYPVRVTIGVFETVFVTNRKWCTDVNFEFALKTARITVLGNAYSHFFPISVLPEGRLPGQGQFPLSG